MAGGVGERFTQNCQQVRGQLRRHPGVDDAIEFDAGPEVGPIGDVVDELEDLGPKAAVLMGLEREDAGADLPDRLVDLVDGLHEPGPVRVTPDVGHDRLQHHPDCEEPLDDRVVKVARDALPVLELSHLVTVVPAARELDGQRGLVGERLDDPDLAASNGWLPLPRPTRSTPRGASCPVSGT